MPRVLRSSKRFNQALLGQAQLDPELQAVPVRTFGYKGEDKTSPVSRLSDGYARLVRDLMFRDGVYKSRDGLNTLGAAATAAIVNSQEIILSTGTQYPVRWKTNGVEVFNGGVWTATTGLAWSTTNVRPFSMTGWADTVVFAEDTNGIYSLAFTAGFPITQLTTLTNVQHLATFAGRIIASLPDRIQWSVRNDNTDWAGVGSGFEDLRSAAGGRSDSQTAVIPVSDDTAILIRTGSVWQMVQTGDFDAPFQFTRIVEGSGGKYPRCCAAIPGGAMWLGQDGSCWIMRLGERPRDISGPIYKQLRTTPGLLRLATAMYDPRYDEFRICIPTNDATAGVVYRYNLKADLWTEDSYKFPIRSMSFALYAQAITIDELIGIIDDLPGVIDDLTEGFQKAETMFSMADPRRYTVIENLALNVNPLRDILYDGTRTDGSFRIETAPVKKDPLHRTEVLDMILEYETDMDSDFDFYYSEDGGATWTLLYNIAVTTTAGPRLLPLQYPIDRDQTMLAIASDDVSSMRIIDLFAMVRGGGLRTDAG